MEFKTKYDIGDEVWTIDRNNGTAKQKFIIGLKYLAHEIRLDGFKFDYQAELKYELANYRGECNEQTFDVTEDKVFKTKEELIKSL